MKILIGAIIFLLFLWLFASYAEKKNSDFEKTEQTIKQAQIEELKYAELASLKREKERFEYKELRRKVAIEYCGKNNVTENELEIFNCIDYSIVK